jgi:predicted peptidase
MFKTKSLLFIFILSTCLSQESKILAAEALRPLGSEEGANFGYVEYLPNDYDSKDKWPFILFLHGIGERAPKELSVTGNFGPHSQTRKGKDLPFVILSPQCPAKGLWQSKPEETQKFVDFAFKKYKLDPDRFYITGLSMGGYGTSAYLNKYSEKVAAAIAICPAFLPEETVRRMVSHKTPLWAAHSMTDPIVKIQKTSDETFSHISVALGGSSNLDRPVLSSSDTKTGYFDPGKGKFVWEDGQQAKENVPEFFYTVYGNGGHTIWTRMYNDSQIYDWLLKHVRKK